MKRFFQRQKTFKVFVRMALVVFLGFATSCDNSDDDKKSSSSKGGATSFTFKDGANSINEAVKEGVHEEIGDVAGTAGALEDDKIPNTVGTGNEAQICSYKLEGTGLPTLTFLGAESQMGLADDAQPGTVAKKFVEALGEVAEKEYQGYTFTVSAEGDQADGSDGTLRVQVTPQLNVAYSVKFRMHPSDCTSTTTSEFKTITMDLPKTTVTGEEAGKPAIAYKIFGKGKAIKNEDQEESDSVTIDGFEIVLANGKLTPSKLANALKAKINGNAFKASEEVEGYLAGPYTATVETKGDKCGLAKGKRLSAGVVCLVLKRILWGEEGNKEKVSYEQSYTKAN